MENKKCKRCNMKTVLNSEEIEEAVNKIISTKGIKLVDEEVYLERISKCFNCEKFEYGSTCMLCGCLMQVRARLYDGKCPAKKWSK